MTHVVENDDEQYKKDGLKAKKIIEEVARNEGIILGESYQAKVRENAVYIRTKKPEKSYIVTPKETSISEMEQAVILAHELGHHFVYEKSSIFKRMLLGRSRYSRWIKHYSTTLLEWMDYWDEDLAWDEARLILEKCNVFPDVSDGKNRTNRAWEDYNWHRSKGLSSYAPAESLRSAIFNPILKPILFVVKTWVFLYFFLGALWVFEKNGVPIPFVNSLGFEEISDTQFYNVLNGSASTFVLLVIVGKIFGWTMKK